MSEEHNKYTTPATTIKAKSPCIHPENANSAAVPITNYITIVPPKINKYPVGSNSSVSYLSSNTTSIEHHNDIYAGGIGHVSSPSVPPSQKLYITPLKPQHTQDGSHLLIKADDDLHHSDDINPYNVKSLDEILDGVCPIEYKTMIRDYSSRMFKRIDNCGCMLFEFKASECNSSTYISSQCHSDLCFECIRNDRRTYNRVINHIGHDLLSNYHWIKLIITIPKDYRHHFLDYDVIDKFTNGTWDLLSNILDLKAHDRFDRGGAVFKWHWFGNKNNDFNPHLEVMIPCIRNGLQFSSKIPQKDLKRIKRGIARRLSNISGEKVPISRMNVKNKPKTTIKQVLHGFRYQLRSTINFKALMEAPDAVKQFMVDGRHGKKQVRYKGKLWSTEIKGWYKHLGFDYETRNKTKKQTWVDDHNVPYEFVNRHNTYTLSNELKQYGSNLRPLSRVSFCINNPSVVNQKVNEIVKSGLESNNNKLVGETIWRLKNYNSDGFKMSWSNEVIELAINRKNYMIENEAVTTPLCKQRITHFKSMDEKDREHWLAVESEDGIGISKSGFPTKTTNLIKRRW